MCEGRCWIFGFSMSHLPSEWKRNTFMKATKIFIPLHSWKTYSPPFLPIILKEIDFKSYKDWRVMQRGFWKHCSLWYQTYLQLFAWFLSFKQYVSWYRHISAVVAQFLLLPAVNVFLLFFFKHQHLILLKMYLSSYLLKLSLCHDGNK